MHHRQCPVAFVVSTDNDADSRNIVDFVKFLLLPLHLLVDAVEMLGSPAQVHVGDVGAVQAFPQNVHNLR